MFKVGDIVVATCERNHPYSITCNGWVGRVVAVLSDGKIDVECADLEDEDYDEESVYTVSSKHFKLLSSSLHNSEQLDKMFDELM